MSVLAGGGGKVEPADTVIQLLEDRRENGRKVYVLATVDGVLKVTWRMNWNGSPVTVRRDAIGYTLGYETLTKKYATAEGVARAIHHLLVVPLVGR